MLNLRGSALHDLLAGELLTVSRGGFPAGEGHGPTLFQGPLTAGPCADAQRSPPCSALRSDTPAVVAFLWPPFPRASAQSFSPPSIVVLRLLLGLGLQQGRCSHLGAWGLEVIRVSLSCCCGLKQHKLMILQSWSSEVGVGLTGLRSRYWQGCAPSGNLGELCPWPFPASGSLPHFSAPGPLLHLQSQQHRSNPSYWCLSDLLLGLPHPPLRVLEIMLGPPGLSKLLPVYSSQ